jgi:glucoamylase
VQCGQVGSVGTDTTFTIALGYGGDAASAIAAANGSLTAGFTDREAAYRGSSPNSGGWGGYVNGLRPAPASVLSDTQRRRAYYVAAMALHTAEDKTFRGASVAGFATPWGDFTNGDNLNDGYHRVWGRDLYQQAIGLIASGDSAQALRMAQFLWNSQYISATTPGGGDDVSARLVPALQPGQRDRRCDAGAARLLRAVRPGCVRDRARLDDRSDRRRHIPEDQSDGKPHPGGARYD